MVWHYFHAEVLNKMATKAKKTETPKENNTDQNDSATDPSLEKVRDILFGEQVRDQNQRYNLLNQEFTKKVDELRNFTTAQLEIQIKDNAAHLKNEQADREQLGHEVFVKLDELAHTLSELESKLEQTHEELFDNIQIESKRLTEEMHDMHEKTMLHIKERSELLHDVKADRNKLAEMFSEMAAHLANDEKS